jgi:hypothetical protein
MKQNSTLDEALKTLRRVEIENVNLPWISPYEWLQIKSYNTNMYKNVTVEDIIRSAYSQRIPVRICGFWYSFYRFFIPKYTPYRHFDKLYKQSNQPI